MSLAYLYTCDNCGATAQTDRHWPRRWGSGPRLPRGWLTTIRGWPPTISDKHRCPSCVEAEELASKAALAARKEQPHD